MEKNKIQIVVKGRAGSGKNVVAHLISKSLKEFGVGFDVWAEPTNLAYNDEAWNDKEAALANLVDVEILTNSVRKPSTKPDEGAVLNPWGAVGREEVVA